MSVTWRALEFCFDFCFCAGKGSWGSTGRGWIGDERCTQECFLKLEGPFPTPAAIPCSITQQGSHAPTSPAFLGSTVGKLLFGLSCWWGAPQQQLFRGYLRMGYPEPTCGIKNHHMFAQSQRWRLSSEAGGLRRGAGLAHKNKHLILHCSRMLTYFFLRKKGGKEKKQTNQNNAKGKHQQENSMFFVMLFLWGHLLLAIRLNRWNLPWSYICHCLHFPTSVIN